ncbi:hypothetical protein EON64_21155 [archaeon]|nr:MAG: hypothetical protein EON64_21155 [archaeon]
MMGSGNMAVVVPALRTLGNIVSGNETQTQAVVNAGVVSVVPGLLLHGRKSVRKETCWLLSNIAAGTAQQMQQLFATLDVLPLVLQQMSAGSEWEVRKEAAWVVSNLATSGQQQHVVQLAECGAIRPLCELLDASDAKIVLLALDALDAILKSAQGGKGRQNMLAQYTQLVDEAGGVDLLEKLQEHEDHKIYQRAVDIIEKYFGTDHEEESQNIVPNSTGSTFSFGMPTTGKASLDFNDAFFSSTQHTSFQF